MNTKDIAHRLVALCREGKWSVAQEELFAPEAVSMEAEASPAFAKETKGRAAIIAKGKQFDAMVEQFHSLAVSEPVVAEQSFACVMTLDATMKGRGRVQMSETCLYHVKDGKIVLEQFHP
jgi:ketosteroid isomerase-like protein